MIKIIESTSDTYITNRLGRLNANVGNASTLDLFKIKRVVDDEEVIDYSRALIKFDLADIDNQKIDINDSSFFAKLSLKDAYGGQTTPLNFKIEVHPLEKQFDEGIGRDIAGYSDVDSCNFITSSWDKDSSQYLTWSQEGCSSPEYDFNGNISGSQEFKSGEEDLFVDVTNIVRDMIDDDYNNGFRISFSEDHIEDNRNYFVKRFSGRNAYDESKRPTLIIGFDDSLQDTSTNMSLFRESKFITKNFSSGTLTNLTNRLGVEIIGENCLKLKISGLPGKDKLFSGSQAKVGSLTQTGIYSSSVRLTFDDLNDLFLQSSSGSIGIFSTPKSDDNDNDDNNGFSFYDSNGIRGDFIFKKCAEESEIDPSSSRLDDVITFEIPFSGSSKIKDIAGFVNGLINEETDFEISSTLRNNNNGTFSVDLVQNNQGINENNNQISSIGNSLPRGINVSHFNVPELSHGDYYLTSSWVTSDLSHDVSAKRIIKLSTINQELPQNLHLMEVSSKINDEIQHGIKSEVNVYLFDKTSPYTAKKIFGKLPSNFQGLVTDAHYCIREALTNREVIPFDLEKGSTRLSSDFEKLFFTLDTSNLSKNRSYVIDILLISDNKKTIFKNSSPVFKVTL